MTEPITIIVYPRGLKSKKRRIIKKWDKKYGSPFTGYISDFRMDAQDEPISTCNVAFNIKEKDQ